jgi:hypothetical protein
LRRLLPLLLAGALAGLTALPTTAQNLCSPSTATTSRAQSYPGSTPYSNSGTIITSNCTGPVIDPGVTPDPYAGLVLPVPGYSYGAPTSLLPSGLDAPMPGGSVNPSAVAPPSMSGYPGPAPSMGGYPAGPPPSMGGYGGPDPSMGGYGAPPPGSGAVAGYPGNGGTDSTMAPGSGASPYVAPSAYGYPPAAPPSSMYGAAPYGGPGAYGYPPAAPYGMGYGPMPGGYPPYLMR